jgi:hypothetical protein
MVRDGPHRNAATLADRTCRRRGFNEAEAKKPRMITPTAACPTGSDTRFNEAAAKKPRMMITSVLRRAVRSSGQ